MPSDIKTRTVASQLLNYNIVSIALMLAGVITGTYLLGEIFLENVETAWLTLYVSLFVFKAIRKAVRAGSRNITWAFVFNAVFAGIVTMAAVACWLLSLRGRSVLFGEIEDSFTFDFFGIIGNMTIFILIGYIGVTTGVSAIVRHTSVRTKILTKAFIVMTVFFFITLFFNINGVIPWLKQLDVYIIYMGILCLYGAMVTRNIPLKYAKYIESRNLEKATLRDWMEFKLEKF